MKYTIEDLRNGVCAVKNDGTIEELRNVLKMAFPYDRGDIGNFYCYLCLKKGIWHGVSQTNLPTQSVKDFLEEKTFPRRMLVWDNENEYVEEAIVLGNFNDWYVCVSIHSEEEYNNKDEYAVHCWRHAKELPTKKTITIEVTEEQENQIKELLK